MNLFHGNAKKEWEENIQWNLENFECVESFFEERYTITTKNGTIEIMNPTWTNIREVFEEADTHKTYIARFALNDKETIDIFIENIIFIRKLTMGKYDYDSARKEIIFTRTKEQEKEVINYDDTSF